MWYDECITQPCPPPVETFSFRRYPCRFEQLCHRSTTAGDAGSDDCPDVRYCRESSPALARLEQAFGSWLKVTLAEPSSSIVVRSEHQFNRQERRRLSLRKHLYELGGDQSSSRSRNGRRNNADLQSDFELSRRFVEVVQKQLAGNQLFVRDSARLKNVVSTLNSLVGKSYASHELFYAELENLLTGPENHATLEYVASQAFSPLDCYRLQEQDRLGHYVGFVDLRPYSAASPLALGVLGLPRRYRHTHDAFVITGNYGPLFGGPSFRSTVYSMHDPHKGGAHCAQACVIMALGMLADRGAMLSGSYTLTYLAKSPKAESPIAVSQDSECLANSASRQPSRKSFSATFLNSSEIETVLKNRNVSAKRFVKKNSRENRKLAKRLIEAYVAARFPAILAVNSARWWPWHVKPEQPGHAVIVVGTRRLPGRADKIALITHDPGYVPYYEKSFDECMDACGQLGKSGELKIVFAAQRTVKRHCHKLVELLRDEKCDDSTLANQYFTLLSKHRTDYRFGLFVRDNVAELLYGRSVNPPGNYVHRLQLVLDKYLPRSRYWCVGGLRKKKLEYVWLFDAGVERIYDQHTPWDARLRFFRDLSGRRAVTLAVFDVMTGKKPSYPVVF